MVNPNMIDDVLCADVLLELFRYFYIDEIFHSFNEVIYDLPLILGQGARHLHIRRIDKHFRKYILPKIDPNHVVSIRIPNLYHMAPIDLSQFKNVQSLRLFNVTEKNWPDRFPRQTKSLFLYVRSRDRHELFHRSLTLAPIERLEFHSKCLHFRESDRILAEPSKIKHLIFSSQRCFIDYRFLVNNLPDLQTFKSNVTYYPHRFEVNLSRFSSLQSLSLSCRYIDIEEMISFLSKTTVKSLRRCQIVNTDNSLSSGIAVILIS